MRNARAEKFDALVKDVTPQRRARIDAKKREMLAAMSLFELRRARELSQRTLAQVMHVPQSAISKIERRTDAYIGTIRRYLEAMGGTLRIVARFGDGQEIEINQFADIKPKRFKAASGAGRGTGRRDKAK